MSTNNPFVTAGTSNPIPEGDAARQAIDSLRGYAYQVLASALAWIDIGDTDRVFLEVAEDFALVAQDVLNAVQVKDTAASGSITLNSGNVRDAIASFVDLSARNPAATVSLRYLTTSPLGTERTVADRPGGVAGLEYWRKAASGADVSPLRSLLESDAFPNPVRDYVRTRDDGQLRTQLLQRIQWDCRQPSFADLREELQERLIAVGRDRFGLPAPDARRLADVLAFHVLRSSVLPDPAQRVLKKSELYEILGTAAEVTLPRTALNGLLSQAASGFGGVLAGMACQAAVVAATDPGWLIARSTITSAGRFITRPAVQDIVAHALDMFGASILTGASGLGKSHVARIAAEARADAFVMVDFRDADAAESRRRLDTVFGRIGGLAAPVVIFEDLNHFDDPQVSRSFSRVMHALRHRDRVALVTCYRAPTSRTMSIIGVDPACVVECPYFSEEQTGELVALYGGDAALWGRLAHIAGAWGHPQLNHAFVMGMAARGWPRGELVDVVSKGLTSVDIEAERESARRNLIGQLPDHARALLYRLSLLIGRFSRATALALAGDLPPVPQAGEALDLLIGPWLEVFGLDQYRVSPLASGTGRNMLSEEEQQRLHAGIAGRMLTRRTINASDLDSIVMHALIGQEDSVLFRVAYNIINMPSDKLALLTESTSLLRIIEPETTFEQSRAISAVLLRLAQFKLLDAAAERDKAAQSAMVAMDVATKVPEGELRTALEIMVLSTVLATMNVGDYFDDWLAWLQRWRHVTALPGLALELRAGFDEGAQAAGTNPYAMFFHIGTARITSVARLEKIINNLAALDAAGRDMLLRPIDKSMSDYSLLINGPWANRQRDPDFDAAEAAAGYGRIAAITKDWGIPALAIQPWLTRAVMLDEFLADGDGALAVLDEAASVLGDGPLLARGRAMIFYRRDDHAKSLEILRGIADVIGNDNAVERAFALRQAAISAANCVQWAQAEDWFRGAQAAAREGQTDDLKTMAIGLGADAAVAAVQQGKTAVALLGFAEMLTAIASIDPEASLNAAYLHRAARHVVLWAKAFITGINIEIDGQPISIYPGACSNPEPAEAIRQLPLGAIDLTWYLLAECEIGAGIDEGIARSLPDRLSDGPILMLEVSLSHDRMKRAVETSDADSFVRNLPASVSAHQYVLNNALTLREGFEPTAPARGSIPAGDLTTAVAEQLAGDAIVAFGLRALFAGNASALPSLHRELQNQLGPAHPGHRLFAAEVTEPGLHLLHAVRTMIGVYASGELRAAPDFWQFGFRCFEQLSRSNFGPSLFPVYAAWLRESWERILRTQRFLLRQPLRTEPPIRAALANPGSNRAYAATLLLAAIDAVAVRLAPIYLAELREAEKQTF